MAGYLFIAVYTGIYGSSRRLDGNWFVKEIEPPLFNVSRKTLSYRSYNSQIHIIVGDTF